MPKKNIVLGTLLLALLPPLAPAADWEWQLSAGPWVLAPLTSPVQRQAERIVSEEAAHLLAPLLSEFTVSAIEPEVDLRSKGYFLGIACWRRLASSRFGLGISASYLDFSLPFTLMDERTIYYQEIPIATITTRGEGEIKLRTFMLAAQGRWRAFQSGRTSMYTGLGLALLHFNGDLHLPLIASVQSFFGSQELSKTEDITLAEIRKENDDIPGWSLSPSLSVSLHFRLDGKRRLFIEIGLSQGTFLAAGLSFGS